MGRIELERTALDGGFIYAERAPRDPEAWPLLVVHGVGGHHRNFALLHSNLREVAPRAIPYLMDAPGFGYARDADLSLAHIRRFLSSACTWIAQACGRPVVIFQESASVWFTLGLPSGAAVVRDVTIVYNPVRVFRPAATVLKDLRGKSVLDVRRQFLARYFPPERIKRMDADELGRPSITLPFLAELWKVQKLRPLEGWTRAVLIETSADPLREFRTPLTHLPVKRYEFQSTQHGIGEDPLARRTAEVVQEVLEALTASTDRARG